MSPKILSLATGLTALGLSLSATCSVADEPPGPAPSPAPSASVAPSPTVLLLSNGKVFLGKVTEDDAGYRVEHKLGTLPVRRRDVEGAFATLNDAYEYKLKRTPERDPGERLKLARWCLDQKLVDQAKDVLEKLVALDPDDPHAKAMLYSLNATAQRAVGRDAMVARTSAVVDAAGPGEPGALDLSGVRDRKARGVNAGTPVILDLPAPLAVRKYQDFARNVHPELQRRCVKCHHENAADRPFQLVQVQTRRDASNDLLVRTNLDAFMKYVKGDDLVNSEILNLMFKPHGGPGQPPLYSGPNDARYQLISAWVTGLQASRPAGPLVPGVAGFVPQPQPAGGPGFAIDRPAGGTPKPAPRPAAGGPNLEAMPTEAPVDADFQTTSPTLIGGPTAARLKLRGAGAPVADKAPDGAAPLLDANGQPVIGPDGQPVYQAPAAPASKDRKPKNFNLDGKMIQGILKKPG